MQIKVEILQEAGYHEALYGLSLNKLQPITNMPRVAENLSKANKGSHRKFMRQIQIWMKVTAPLYLWQQIDTYKIGTVRQSSSIMNNAKDHVDYYDETPMEVIALHRKYLNLYLEGIITLGDYRTCVPSGLMSTSVLSLNYEVVTSMLHDRKSHKLFAWREFLETMIPQLQHPELLGVGEPTGAVDESEDTRTDSEENSYP